MRYFLAIMMICCLFGYSDVIKLRTGQQEGVFIGYHLGRFTFRDWKTLQDTEYNDAVVISITMDKPMVCSLLTKRDAQRKYPVKVFGYADRRFDLEIDGSRRQTPAMQIGKMGFVLTPKEIKERWDILLNKKGITPEANIMDKLPEGKITIVHFMMEDDKGDAGKIAENLCKTSKKPAVYIPIVLQNKKDPMAVKYHLDILPQMWFFSPKRTRVDTISGKGLTPKTIKAAFKETLLTK